MIDLNLETVKEVIGPEIYDQIRREFAGCRFYIPKEFTQSEREEMYMQKVNAGYTHAQAVEYLAAVTGKSHKWTAEYTAKFRKKRR